MSVSTIPSSSLSSSSSSSSSSASSPNNDVEQLSIIVHKQSELINQLLQHNNTISSQSPIRPTTSSSIVSTVSPPSSSSTSSLSSSSSISSTPLVGLPVSIPTLTLPARFPFPQLPMMPTLTQPMPSVLPTSIHTEHTLDTALSLLHHYKELESYWHMKEDTYIKQIQQFYQFYQDIQEKVTQTEMNNYQRYQQEFEQFHSTCENVYQQLHIYSIELKNKLNEYENRRKKMNELNHQLLNEKEELKQQIENAKMEFDEKHKGYLQSIHQLKKVGY